MQAIQDIAIPLLEVSKPKELAHGMKIYRAVSQGPFSFKLQGLSIPFGPSVFNGTGDEERMSLVFNVPEDVADIMNKWTESFQLQLEKISPDLSKKWHSSIKPANDKYPAQLRTKLNVKGDKACQCYDMEGEYTSLPHCLCWRGLEVNAIIRFGGVYVQKANAGMLFDVTALQFDPSVSREQNPFA